MHIKQIELCGFKSYKDKLVTEPFCPKINVVVGANGSGKSNFFHAIRFVLNDVVQMRAEERQQLLHEGTGYAVPTAYVEVVFDNSDGRFPIDRDEVRLRRTISKSKDEYHLDKKPITKAEVANLLESAGFSRANPYYIVQQGKIMHMSHMKDTERLSLLKEIGGTGVYEERRKESLKVMGDTETRRAQIEDMMTVIEEKLKDLDGERKELAEYMVVDKQRRCVEYNLADMDLTACRADLAKLRAEQDAAREEATKRGDDAATAAAQIAQLSADADTATASATALSRQLNNLEERRNVAAEAAAHADAEALDLERTLALREEAAIRASEDSGTLVARIEEAQAQLEQARSEASTADAAERALQARLEAAEARLQALYQKQGRGRAFSSSQERDAWVTKEVGQLEGTLAQESARAKELADSAHERNEQLNTLAQAIGDREAEVRTAEGAAASSERRLAEVRLERDRLQNRRKEVWRSETEIGARVGALQAELRKRKAQLDNATARDISRGLAGLERVVAEHGVAGVHGRLVDLIDCAVPLSTAVEVTAGNSLFHVVVEDDNVAIRCTELLNRNKAGRVTFMPLNRLQPKQMDYPTEHGTDVIPLARKVKCDARFERAVQQVFGKVLLCRSSELASAVAHRGAFDCVTVEGVQVSKRGALTGGYYENGAGRLDHMRAIRAASAELLEAQAALAKCEAERVELDAAVTARSADLVKEEQARRSQRDALLALREELTAARREHSGRQGETDALERDAEAAEHEAARLRSKVATLRAELGTPLRSALSDAERKEAASLPTEVSKLKEELKALSADAAAKASRRAALETLLRDDLLRRRTELADEGGAAAGDAAADQAALQGRRAEAAAARAELDKLSEQLSSVQAKLEEVNTRLAELERQRGVVADAEGRRARAQASSAGSLEVLASRRAALLAREADTQRRITELGGLPADALSDKYVGKSRKALHKQLEKVNAELAKFGSVNRKALDQYMMFTEQREELRVRKAELDRSENKIRELISALDMRKDEAIERTFKGVAKHFRDAFAELVPGGKGELVMQKRLGDAAAAAVDDADDAIGGGMNASEKYIGVKVRVAFTRGGETMSLKQLSGGQRTLVALTLIFAIQRCDPAPFYLFDEVDAALDPQYRTTVAQMLRRQADSERNPVQFIVTTFHPQIVGEADRLMGVSHNARVSRVFTITHDAALEFLEAPDEGAGAGEGVRERTSGAQAAAGGGGEAAEDVGKENADGDGSSRGSRAKGAGKAAAARKRSRSGADDAAVVDQA